MPDTNKSSLTGDVSIFPLADHVRLPPPLPSESRSSSSSSRKRKRISPSGSSVTLSTVAGAFSPTTKQIVTELMNDKSCWHCGATPYEYCHVIGKKDTSFPKIQQKKLVSFETLGDKDNVVALCPTCHRNYDNVLDPGLLFIPIDLDFFINFERRDQQRREEQMIKTQSPPPARVPPGPEVYREFQRQQGLIGEEDIGGLYNCYVLKEYLPRLLKGQSTVGLSPLFETPHAWHGSPTAAIHRATGLIPKLHNIVPQEIVRKLFTLSELYAQDIEWQPTRGLNDHHADPGNGEGSFHSKDSSKLGQQPGISRIAGQNLASEPSGLAIQHCASDGQDQRRVEKVGEHLQGRKRAQKSPSLGVKSVKTGQIEFNRSKRQKLDPKPSWGPDSTSADAMSFFTDVWNIPYTPPESPSQEACKGGNGQ